MASIQIIKKADIEATFHMEEAEVISTNPVRELEEEVQGWVESHREHGAHDPSLGRLFSVRRPVSRAGGII